MFQTFEPTDPSADPCNGVGPLLTVRPSEQTCLTRDFLLSESSRFRPVKSTRLLAPVKRERLPAAKKHVGGGSILRCLLFVGRCALSVVASPDLVYDIKSNGSLFYTKQLLNGLESLIFSCRMLYKCGRFTYLSLDYSSGNKIKLVKIRIAFFVSVASAKSLNHLMTSLMTNQTKLERSRFLN